VGVELFLKILITRLFDTHLDVLRYFKGKDGSQFMPLHLAIHQADTAGCGFWNRLHYSKTDKPPGEDSAAQGVL
jgi:hypothetical protein